MVAFRFAGLLPVLLLLVSVSGNVLAQNPRTVPTRLEEVTVFQDRAQLLHVAATQVESGTTALVLTGLPSHIDMSSLTVEAKGNVLMQGVVFQNNFQRTQQKPAIILKLEDSLEYYRDQIRVHTDQRDILTKEEALIMANQKTSGDDGVEVIVLEEVADFFRQRMTKIRALIMQEDKILKRLQRRHDAVQQQLNELNNRPSQPTGEVLVSVSAQSRASVSFVVSYVVPNAGWTAHYDLRAKDTNSPIKLYYKGNVQQQTGLDWKQVKLTLSSATPAVGGDKPELYQWYVRSYEPKKLRQSRASSLSEEEKAAGLTEDWASSEWGDDGGDAAPAATTANHTKALESALSFEFRIEVPMTIPSDGRPHPVELMQHDLEAKYQHMAVPKYDPTAFLMARATGHDQLNLIPGSVNTYFAGTFVGSTYLYPGTTLDTLNISLGRDKNVVVSRTQVKDFKGKSLLGNKVKETRGFELAVRNTKNTPVTITLEDQIPISGNTEVEITAEELSGGKLEPNTGKVSWQMTLKPSETRKVQLRFEVKYPKGHTVQGL